MKSFIRFLPPQHMLVLRREGCTIRSTAHGRRRKVHSWRVGETREFIRVVYRHIPRVTLSQPMLMIIFMKQQTRKVLATLGSLAVVGLVALPGVADAQVNQQELFQGQNPT